LAQVLVYYPRGCTTVLVSLATMCVGRFCSTATMLATIFVGMLNSAQAVSSGSSAVQALTKSTFDSFLEKEREQQRPCLVMFHVDWCKVCQRTFPKFANASEAVKQAGINLDFAHVDCTDEKAPGDLPAL